MKIENRKSDISQGVAQGYWKQISPAGIYECSACRGEVMTDTIEAYRYCHQCGAIMSGVAFNLKKSISAFDLWQSRPEKLIECSKDQIKSAYANGWNACIDEFYRLIGNASSVSPSLMEPNECVDDDTQCGCFSDRCCDCEE